MSKLEKMRIFSNENKTSGNDTLIFYVKDNLLNVYLNNGISAFNFCLNFPIENEKSFAVDANLFYNAFSNFPTDDVQFALIDTENSLIFGNKKTRVALRTSEVSNVENLLFNSFDFSKETKFEKLDFTNFTEALKLTSFSCSPDIDQYPYTSILFFLNGNKVNCTSSDKHRISVYGDKYNGEISHLLPKLSADLMLNFINKIDDFCFAIYKNKLLLKWENNIFSTSLENNNYQKIFEEYNVCFDDSKFVLSISIDKQQILQSIKYIGNISSSHEITMLFEYDKLVLSGKSEGKGTVVDQIQLDKEYENLEVSYSANHLTKVIEMLPEDQIELAIHQLNDYYLLLVRTQWYSHIVFPKS